MIILRHDFSARHFPKSDQPSNGGGLVWGRCVCVCDAPPLFPLAQGHFASEQGFDQVKITEK